MTSDEIFDYVKGLHSYEEDLYEGDLGKRIMRYPVYVLQLVPIGKIKGHWEVYQPTVDDYASQFLKSGDYPPIVLQPSFVIIDGTHRYKALVSSNVQSVLAYVGQRAKK
jgi:ParB-like chromosome segregation protein Spo0J